MRGGGIDITVKPYPDNNFAVSINSKDHAISKHSHRFMVILENLEYYFTYIPILVMWLSDNVGDLKEGKWLIEHSIGPIHMAGDHIGIFFKDKDDAFKFKLVWA